MKLDAKTVATLKLGGKNDAIHFDGEMAGFGFRLRLGAGGKVLRSWVVQYKRAGPPAACCSAQLRCLALNRRVAWPRRSWPASPWARTRRPTRSIAATKTVNAARHHR